MDLNERDRLANLRYARCLETGSTLALVLIVAELVAYLSGILSPYVPLSELPRLWKLPMREFLAAAHVPTGWGWLALIGRGDYLNFFGIALLASVSLAGCLAAIGHYRAQGDRTYVLLAAAQALVTLAAASGLLN